MESGEVNIVLDYPASALAREFLRQLKKVPWARGSLKGWLHLTMTITVPQAREPEMRTLLAEWESEFVSSDAW